MKNNIKSNDKALDKKRPMLALTFDDGPSAHTNRLLDIFKEHGQRGTFFVVGELIDSRPDTLKRACNEGHEIGNHSWDHKALTYLTDEELVDEIQKPKEKLRELLGIDCKILRPPYGDCGDNVKVAGKELGVSFINWSVDTVDWKTLDADAVYREAVSGAENGAIILCHDSHKTTVDAMEKVIPKLIEMGYQLVTVTELLSCSDRQLVAGELYYRQ